MVKRQGLTRTLRESLFVRALLVTALGVVLVGGGVTYWLSQHVKSAVQEDAIFDVVEMIQPRILRIFSPQDLAQPLTGSEYERLDQMVHDTVLELHVQQVERIRIWNPAGTVVYSSLPAQIGESIPGYERVAQALQGETVWAVTGVTESVPERGMGEVLEVYVPLTWEPDGRPIGVLEVYIPYAQWAGLFVSIRNAVLGAIFLVALTLPAAVYLLYRSGWREIRRERDLAAQSERALQESEERFRGAFENSAIGMVLSGTGGQFLKVNLPFCQMLGYSEQQLLKTTFQAITHPDDADTSVSLMRQMLAGEIRSCQFEKRYIHRLGHEVWARLSVSLVRNPQNNPLYFVTQIEDITERKRMAEALQQSEQLYRHLVELAPVGIAVHREGAIVLANAAAASLLGAARPEELVGKPILGVVHPDYRPLVMERVRQMVQEKRAVPLVEEKFLRLDGAPLDVEVVAAPITFEGEPAIQVIVRDITERKQAEELLRTVSENAPIGIYLVRQGRFLFVNPQFREATGYSEDVLLGTDPLSLVFHEDRNVVRKNAVAMLKGNRSTPYQYRFVNAEGEIRWALETVASVHYQGTPATLAVVRDVTEHKQAEEALQQSEQLYRAVVEGVAEGISIVVDGKRAFVNRAFLDIFGLQDASRALDTPFEDLYLPDERPRLRERMEALVRGDPVPVAAEFRFQLADGAIRTVQTSSSQISYQGQPATLAVVRDITERKRMEEALKQSSEFLRTVIDSVNDSISVIDVHDYRIAAVNRAYLEQLGLKEEQVMGKTCYEVTHRRCEPCAPPDCPCPIANALASQAHSVGQHVHYDGAGNAISVEVSVSPIRDASGNIVQVVHVARDITQRKELEKERIEYTKELEDALQQLRDTQEHLMQADRLASLGQLVSGVAHELNNPLTVVSGFAELLSRRDLDDGVKEGVETIYRESQRATRIIQNLLSFARQHKPEMLRISINEAVENVLRLRAYEMRVNDIEVIKELQPDLPNTMADYYQMQQVFMNIVINAEQAMGEARGRGTLLVRTQQVGQKIQVTFADDGPGIPKESRSKVFAPFFTTKEPGKGTGLGLSICHSIVHEHGGTIRVKSVRGQGATFIVEIPIRGEEASPPGLAADGEHPGKIPSGHR